MSTDGIVDIVHIKNLLRSRLQIIVKEPLDTGSTLFVASGIVFLAPMEVVEIELDRIDLAQLEHYFQKRMIHLIIMQRDVDSIT